MIVAYTLRALGLAAVAGFLLVGFTPLANMLAFRIGAPERLAPADAIVVLGAGVTPDGELSRPSLKRAVRGIELYQAGWAPRLVLLGPASLEGYPSEARIRSLLARTMQVEPEAIVTEERGLQTRQEAALVAERLLPEGVRTILLVTDSQHLLRAVPLFENAGFRVHPAPANDFSLNPDGPGGRIELMQRMLEEQAARIYYAAAGYL